MAASQGPLPIKAAADAILLTSQTAAVATSTGTAAVFLPRANNAIAFELNVTAAATGAGDTLDVFVQTMIDTANWVDVAHFTQVLGNGGTKRFFTKITAALTQAEFENATALGAAAVRQIIGDQWRVRFAIVDGGAHGQSFDFAVWACAM